MKIALIENFGSDFYGARLRYALFLKQKGHQVVAIVPNDGYVEKIKEKGIDTYALNIDVRKRSLSNVLYFAKELNEIFRNETFDVVHLYRMQPNLIGTCIAYFSSRKTRIINHITGLGIAFTKTSFKYRMIRMVIKIIYWINSKVFNAKLIFQNEEDKMEMGNFHSFSVIKGSAVNEDKFMPGISLSSDIKSEISEKYGINDGITFIFVSRLLKQKGLNYFIEALKVINKDKSGKKINLLVAGWIDQNNPDSFTQQEIEELGKIDRIVFLGKRTDIDKLITLADIAVLPTFYREGTPRFLLESMACAKPILTTDMPGCNHLVKKRTNGILVKPKSIQSLVKAIRWLSDQELEKLGQASRDIYQSEFSEKVVYNKLLEKYL